MTYRQTAATDLRLPVPTDLLILAERRQVAQQQDLLCGGGDRVHLEGADQLRPQLGPRRVAVLGGELRRRAGRRRGATARRRHEQTRGAAEPAATAAAAAGWNGGRRRQMGCILRQGSVCVCLVNRMFDG